MFLAISCLPGICFPPPVVVYPKVVQRELEDLASTLVLKPVQPESWLLFQAIDVVWRVPAVMIFLVFMGE